MISRLICALVGHAPLTNAGYQRGVGYAKVFGATVDGIGQGHLYLYADCPRCGNSYPICNVHAYVKSTAAPKPEGE